jgi:hypothetical protein
MFKSITLSILLSIVAFALDAQNLSMNFDGTDDEIRVADTSYLTMTDGFTFEAWLKTENLASGYNMIINKEGEFQIGVNGSNYGLAFALANTNPGWAWSNSSAILPPNTWVHLAVVVNTQWIKFYGNSILTDSIAISGTIGDVAPTLNDLTLGWRTSNFDNRYSGYMDDVRLWNYPRTEMEIISNMSTELTGNEGGLVLYYKFDDTTATCDIIDCAPFAKNGTRNGLSGINELPQYTDSIPTLIDVACGENSCFATRDITLKAPDVRMFYLQNQLHTKKYVEETLSLQVYDAIGRNVQSFVVQGEKEFFDVTTLEIGVYFAVLRRQNGKLIQVLKFVR